MSTPFRIIDTGVRDGRHQIALDAALIELHKAGQSPDSIRFLRFPPTVLIGRHQAVSHEVKLGWCRDNGIGLVRRITGGGAIYLDEGQVGWELLISRRRLPMPTLADYTSAICEAVAHGLSRTFGIDARYRPRTDIEVAGKKLCGTGGFFDGDTLIYQGTVLVDVDPAQVYRCLNVPDPGIGDSRLTTLKTLLGGTAPPLAAVYQAVLHGLMAKLPIEPAAGAVTAAEEALAKLMLEEEIAKESFVFEIDDPRGAGVGEARRATPGGNVAAFVRVEGAGEARRIREVLVSGDFFVLPPRFIFDLESALRGVPLAELSGSIDGFLAARKPEMLTLPPADLRDVIVAAAMESGAQ